MEWILESILNDSTQMIQVSDLETYTMLYANEPARSDAGHGWLHGNEKDPKSGRFGSCKYSYYCTFCKCI